MKLIDLSYTVVEIYYDGVQLEWKNFHATELCTTQFRCVEFIFYREIVLFLKLITIFVVFKSV